MMRAFGAVVGKLPVMVFGAVLSFGLAQTQEGWGVTGTVTTDSGPVKGVAVEISGASYLPWATTDGRGSYSLTGVVPGRYLIGVQKEDNISVPKSRTLTLARGTRLKVDFRIPKGGVMSGRVLDGNKQPLRDVVVLALSKTTGGDNPRLREQGSDLTNDLGEYRIPYLPDGAYVVAAIQKNPLPVLKRASGSDATPGRGYPPITFYPDVRLLAAAAVLEIRSGDERPGLDIALQKEATRCVSFKVGAAFGSARVDASMEERLGARVPAFARGRVTAAGSYEICGVAAGEYRLHLGSSASLPGPRGPLFQPLNYQMAVALVDKENVDLGTLEPLAQAEIRGIVTVKDSRPGDAIPAGIRVFNLAWEMQQGYTTLRPEQVNPDGTFVLSKVLLGEYGVQVSGLPARYYVIGASQQGRSVLDRGLWPGNGDLKITLGADGATVTGRVLAADGAAFPDASVFLVPEGSGQHLVAQSDQTGAYQFATGVRPGKYRVVAASDLMGWQLQDTATATRLAANGTEMELGPRGSRTVDLKIPSTR